MTRGPFANRLGAEKFNALWDHGMQWKEENDKHLKEAIGADGYMPLTVKNSPIEQFQTLLSWRAAGDPRYTLDPEAQRAFARLAMTYGTPEALTPLARGSYPGGEPL